MMNNSHMSFDPPMDFDRGGRRHIVLISQHLCNKGKYLVFIVGVTHANSKPFLRCKYLYWIQSASLMDPKYDLEYSIANMHIYALVFHKRYVIWPIYFVKNFFILSTWPKRTRDKKLDASVFYGLETCKIVIILRYLESDLCAKPFMHSSKNIKTISLSFKSLSRKCAWFPPIYFKYGVLQSSKFFSALSLLNANKY